MASPDSATAMVPVLFAYGGWQTASFVSGEMRDSAPRSAARTVDRRGRRDRRSISAVTFVCLRVLGVDGLAATSTPASRCMRSGAGRARRASSSRSASRSRRWDFSVRACSRRRACTTRWRATACSSRPSAKLDPRSRVPVVAIVLQGVWAAVIALTGKYDQILNYVVSIDVLFFGLTGASLLVFRARECASEDSGARPRRRARAWSPGDDDGVRARVLGDFGVDDRAVSRERRYRGGHSIGWRRRLLALGGPWGGQSTQRSLSGNVLRGGRNLRVYRTM